MEYNIQTKGLSKRYDEFLLDNISLSLPKGTILGMVGENGAGKTTIMKLLLGLVKQDAGEIFLLGEKAEKNRQEKREEIGVVFDNAFFYEALTACQVESVLKNIYKNWDTDSFYSLLKKLSVPEKKAIKELSQGMKRKLALAAALSHKPKLLILDEPMNGLDPIVRDEMLDIFLEFIMNPEHSILLSSHITSDLEKVADYIAIIQNGKILLQEEKETLQESYGILKCGRQEMEDIEKEDILRYRVLEFRCEVLVKNRQEIKRKYPDVVIDKPAIEDIMLLLKKGEQA